jgi:alkyl hydroperoxide reductase subunit AhpC
MLSKLGEEFESRNCKVLAVTCSTVSTVRSFLRDTQVRGDVALAVSVTHNRGTGIPGIVVDHVSCTADDWSLLLRQFQGEQAA